LDGIAALPPELLDPPENAFVLFHDEFNEGNIIVSFSDPTRSSGLLTGKAGASRPFGTPDACVPFYGKIS
jgi:hypothetical protein